MLEKMIVFLGFFMSTGWRLVFERGVVKWVFAMESELLFGRPCTCRTPSSNMPLTGSNEEEGSF